MITPNVKLIGIGAMARVGKDTLADFLVKMFQRDGFTVKKYPLADNLKAGLADQIQKDYGVSVWTQDTEEKKKFRHVLVADAKVRRIASQGTYWTGKLQEQIEKESRGIKPYIAIVSDIRYALYENDEHKWVKDNGGLLVHLSRKGIEPANEDEAENDPLVKAAAEFCLEWEDVGEVNLNDLNSYHAQKAAEVYEYFLRHKLPEKV